jgi:hypothetical protein
MLAEAPVQWRLHAVIPTMCSVTSVTQDAADPRRLTVETRCNLQRYALTLDAATTGSESEAKVARARVNIGQAVIAQGRIEITANRPGTAVIELLLAEIPAEGSLSATILPLR